MTFKPDGFRAVLLAVLLTVTGCSRPEEAASLDRVRAALTAGDDLRAEAVLNELMADGVHRRTLAAYFGEAKLAQGNPEEAAEWLEPGDFSLASRAHGHHMTGRLLLTRGDLPAAGKAFDRALAAGKDDAAIWVDIARLRYRGGEQAQAMEAGRRAMAIDPDSPHARLLQAQFARDAGGSVRALPLFEEAVDAAPNDTDLRYDYAVTLGEAGRPRAMLTVLRQLHEFDPGDRRIYFPQAVVAARAGRIDLANSLLQRADAETLATPAARLLSGIIDIENGHFAVAAQTLARLHAEQPDNMRVRDLLARALSLGGNAPELLYRFADVAESTNSSRYLSILVGRSLEVLDRRAEAAPFLDSAARFRGTRIARLPTSVDHAVAELRGADNAVDAAVLVRARLAAGRSNRAIEAARSHLARFPGSAGSMELLADALLAGGLFAEAAGYYADSAAIRQSPSLITKLAAARGLAIGSPSRRSFKPTHTARDPDHLVRLSQAAMRRGDSGAGLRFARAAYRLQPMGRAPTAALAAAHRASDANSLVASQLEAKLAQLP